MRIQLGEELQLIFAVLFFRYAQLFQFDDDAFPPTAFQDKLKTLLTVVVNFQTAPSLVSRRTDFQPDRQPPRQD